MDWMVQYYLETGWRRLGAIGISNIRTEKVHSGKLFYLLTRLILTRELPCDGSVFY